MKRLALFIFVLFFAAVACKNSKESQQQNAKQDTLVTIELKNLETQGDTLIGEKIQVSGYVSHVCHEDGKKLMLWDSVADVRLKVTTENPFDTTLEGQIVTIVGVLNAVPFTMNDYKNLEAKMKEHHPQGLDKEDSLRLVHLYNKLQKSADSTINVYFVKFEKFVK